MARANSQIALRLGTLAGSVCWLTQIWKGHLLRLACRFQTDDLFCFLLDRLT